MKTYNIYRKQFITSIKTPTEAVLRGICDNHNIAENEFIIEVEE